MPLSGWRSAAANSLYQNQSLTCSGGGASSRPARLLRPGVAVLMFGLLLGGTGCASRGAAVPERRALYLTEHPEVPGSFAEAIMAGQIMIGMSPDMVTAAWGKPARVDRRVPPREATPEEAAPSGRVDEAEVGKIWNVRFVYGNYLVNPRVSNLFFVGDHLKLIEYVDTRGQNSISVSDPGARIPPMGGKDTGGAPVKGGAH